MIDFGVVAAHSGRTRERHNQLASRDRERMLARAKLERQQARRAARLRKRRQREAQVAAGVAVLVIIAVVFSVAGGWNALFGTKKAKSAASDTNTTCVWTPASSAASATPSPSASSLGTPPTSNVPTTGTSRMTIATTQGTITASLDRTAAPCTIANFDYLASQNFFDNTTCTRLANGDAAFFLLCGDPSTSDPAGGPGYTYQDENPPLGFSQPPGASPEPSASAGAPPSQVVYPAGTVALWNQSANENGSQFIIVYKATTLPPNYSVFGQVTSGLDVVSKIGSAGVKGSGHDGAPKTTVTINTLTVDPVASTPSAAPSASAGTSVTPSPSPSSSQS
jgi:peptidyl-prolyl cis-trans isomerase B (cyclophilin B)